MDAEVVTCMAIVGRMIVKMVSLALLETMSEYTVASYFFQELDLESW